MLVLLCPWPKSAKPQWQCCWCRHFVVFVMTRVDPTFPVLRGHRGNGLRYVGGAGPFVCPPRWMPRLCGRSQSDLADAVYNRLQMDFVMRKKHPDRKSQRREQRKFVGRDAKGKPVHVGDIVNHLTKPLRGGTVACDSITTVFGEPAVYVLYPPPVGLYKNRLSQLVVTGKRAGYRPPPLPKGPLSMRELAARLPRLPPGPPPPPSSTPAVKILQGGQMESNRRRH